MSYTINHIRKAFELAEIPEGFANRIINYLPEAVRLVALSDPNILNDLFDDFCRIEEIDREWLLSRKRSAEMFEIRLKFTKLAKEKFGKKATQQAIGYVLNRDHATVLWYLRILKLREAKAEKLNKLRHG